MNGFQSGAGFGPEANDREVTAKAKRRSFSAEYKRKILAELDAASGAGAIGELLRREGLYSSTIAYWRKERDSAIHSAFSQKRGLEPKHNPFSSENERLRRQNLRLVEELRKAELIIDIQKKVATLLGRPLPPIPTGENSRWPPPKSSPTPSACNAHARICAFPDRCSTGASSAGHLLRL